ncbi:porin family protein [Vibrio sp. FNV 38]|nr:porin family protein [Vibrio sp. FNV 38]
MTKISVIIVAAYWLSFNVMATELYVTPWIGFTGGGKVVNEEGTEFDFKPSESFALQIEAPLQQGRIGLFYHYQGTEVDDINASVETHYLLFQSAVHYAMHERLRTHIGIGLGGAYTKANWVDDNFGFAGSIYGGLEHEIKDNLYLTGQVRWLGTVVDNDTTAICNLPSGQEGNCVIKFKTDWMNQFSANFGITFKF